MASSQLLPVVYLKDSSKLPVPGCSLSSLLPHSRCPPGAASSCLMAAVLPAGPHLHVLPALRRWGEEAAAEPPQVLLQLRGLSGRDLPEQNGSVNSGQLLPPLPAPFLLIASAPCCCLTPLLAPAASSFLSYSFPPLFSQSLFLHVTSKNLWAHLNAVSLTSLFAYLWVCKAYTLLSAPCFLGDAANSLPSTVKYLVPAEPLPLRKGDRRHLVWQLFPAPHPPGGKWSPVSPLCPGLHWCGHQQLRCPQGIWK